MWTSGTWWEAVRQTWEVLSVGSLIFLVLATHRHPKICWKSTQMLNNMEKISGPVHVMKINHAIIAKILCLRKVYNRLASDRKTHHKYFVATTELIKKSFSTHSTATVVHLWQTFRKCYKMKSLKIKIDTPLRKPDKQTDNYISSITFCY